MSRQNKYLRVVIDEINKINSKDIELDVFFTTFCNL